MKRRNILIALLVILFLSGCAGGAKVRRLSKPEVFREEAPLAKCGLTVGENFIFSASWKGIPIGQAEISVEKLMPWREYIVYKVVVTARTNAFLSKLFPVEDTFISYIDRDKYISRHFEAIIKEGRYRKHLVVDYDFVKFIATYRNLKDGSVKTCPIEKDVQDSISAAVFFRTMPVEVGKTARITVNQNEENYTIITSIDREVDVTIPGVGTFTAFLVKPYIELKGKPLRRAKAWGYMSSDKNRIPLFLSVQVLEIPWIGEVTATLKSVNLNVKDISSS
ncbi:MAG: DUF3108 domain-containing protein [Candidatus Omnitrophota bacterium]